MTQIKSGKWVPPNSRHVRMHALNMNQGYSQVPKGRPKGKRNDRKGKSKL